MKSIVVNVFGSDYNVKADSDGEEHIVEVAGLVDRKMREIEAQYRQPSPARTAVFACMNFADELLKGQRGVDAGWCRHRVGALIDKLDTVIGAG
jgi:cell division protein ZapA (FtsZ GTPase activity inhibitor)